MACLAFPFQVFEVVPFSGAVSGASRAKHPSLLCHHGRQGSPSYKQMCSTVKVLMLLMFLIFPVSGAQSGAPRATHSALLCHHDQQGAEAAARLPGVASQSRGVDEVLNRWAALAT